MKINNIILFILILSFASCNSGSTSTNGSASTSYEQGETVRQKTPEELKMELLEQELSVPEKYLTADGTYKENFWGDKLKIKCTITNKATLATYKDVVLRVTYFTKTKTVLGTKDYSIYEMFSPNSSKTIDMKIETYKDVNTIGWEVISAVAVN